MLKFSFFLVRQSTGFSDLNGDDIAASV